MGYDLVGEIDQLGNGVSGFRLGDHVADMTVLGSNATYRTLRASDLIRVPAGVDAADAATLILSWMTAYQLLHRDARVTRGQHVLVQGAAGAVGQALLVLGGMAGLELWVPQRGGLLCAYGYVASVQPQRRLLDLLARFARVYLGRQLLSWLPGAKRVHIYSINLMRARHPAWFREDLERRFGLLAARIIRPRVAERISFDEIAEAHRRFEAGALQGKRTVPGAPVAPGPRARTGVSSAALSVGVGGLPGPPDPAHSTRSTIMAAVT